MQDYMLDENLCFKPTILKELEDEAIRLNDLNYGLNNVFDPLTNENLEWLSHENYQMGDYFIKFADATASGSEYCFFITDKSKTLENQAIVIFGDEGQINLVAKDFVDWLRLMSIGEEAFLDFEINGATFFERDEEDELTDNLNEFRNALKNHGVALYDFNEEDAYYSFQMKIIEEAQMYASKLIDVLSKFGYDHKDYEGL